MAPIGVLIALLVLVPLVLLGIRQERIRVERLAAFAPTLGFRFSPEPQYDFDSWHAHEVFQRGSSRRAYNLLTGEANARGAVLPCTMGDYRYTVGSGKNRQTHRLSFILLRLPWGSVPDLTIRPEHFVDKLKGAVGFEDIDFESEEFSRKFMVQSPDKRFAYDVVHARMMEYFLEVKGPSVEILNGECLLMSGIKTWTPDDFRARLTWGRRFLDLWPEHVADELKRRSEPAA